MRDSEALVADPDTAEEDILDLERCVDFDFPLHAFDFDLLLLLATCDYVCDYDCAALDAVALEAEAEPEVLLTLSNEVFFFFTLVGLALAPPTEPDHQDEDHFHYSD